jgi:tetratricopeptide (TPR) repeat protein
MADAARRLLLPAVALLAALLLAPAAARAVITFDLLHDTPGTRALVQEDLGASAMMPVEEAGGPATARGDLESLWFTREKYLQIGETEKARQQFQLLWEKSMEQGVRNVPEVSAVLVREAQRRMQTRDFEQATRSLALARKIAPDEFPVSTASALLALKRNPFNLLAAVSEFLQANQAVARSFRLQVWLRANLWLTVVAGLTFFLAFSVAVTFAAVAPRVAHDVRERIPVGSPHARVVLSWMAVAAPALIGFSPWWWLVIGALVAWPYLDWVPRGIVAAGALFVVALPWIVRESATLRTIPGRPALEKIVAVREGHWTPADYRELKVLVEKGEGGVPGLTAAGIAARRLGLLDEADAAYRAALQKAPGDPVLWNNLGNVFFARKDVAGAIENYGKAVQIAPDRFAPHYNLGIAYREGFKFAEGEADARRAAEIDPEAVAYISGLDSSRLKGYTVDDVPGTDELWRLARADGEALEAAAENLWDSMMLGPSLASWPVVALVLLVLGGGLGAWRLRGGVAQACSRCGRVYCRRCQTGKETGLCAQCTHIFVRKEGVDAKVRVQKLAAIKAHARYRRIRHIVCAVLAPGGGHLSAGRYVLGVVFLLPAAFFEARVLLGGGVFPSPWSLGSAAASSFAVAGFVVFGLWWGASLWLATRLEE